MKPDFWQDDKIGSLSSNAKLLAISLLNFADDEGRFQATSARLKVFTFPYEKFEHSEVVKLIEELRAIGYLIQGECDTYQIKNFLRHQVIDRPRRSHIPPIEDQSSNGRRILDGERKGKEGKGRERKKPITTITITKKQEEVIKKAFPQKDWQFEKSQAEAWLVSNPDKPRYYAAKFFRSWLSKSKDKAVEKTLTGRAY